MSLKISSLIALGVALIGIFFLIKKDFVFSYNPITIVIQVCAVILMIWARITFGIRSFHATANTTKGKLETNGPYHWFRHPIYAALIYFFWAVIVAHPFIEVIAAVLTITAGLYARMIFEEKFLLETYQEEYTKYMKTTKRIIPFLI